jgi:hypothetical protein
MKYLFIVLLSAAIISVAAASPIVTYTNAAEKLNIGNKASIRIDTNQTYTIHQILSDTSEYVYPEAMPNLGLSSYVYWATFDLVNTSSENLILKFNQPLLNEITLYRTDGKSLSEITYSESESFLSRKYYYPSYAFDMNANMGDTITYVLRFKSNEPIIFDVDIANQSVIAKEELQQELITGIFIGIIFVMLFYNLFIYFTVLDSSYLAYVCYIICIGLTHITLPGYGFKYIWPNFPAFNDLSVTLFSVFAAVFAIEFLKQFLRTKQHVPRVHKLFSLFEIIFICTLLIYFTGNKLLAFTIIQLITFVLCICIIVTAIKIIYIGYRPAIFFLTAWLILLLSACIFIAKDFDIIPYNFFTIHAMQIGSAVEVILLSFALADKINILKKEKELSQAQAVNALMQNKMILINQNIVLERKVGERTKEIENTNNELYKALAELKKAQTHLLNTEKISSMNPYPTDETNKTIHFIPSVANPLKKDLDAIHDLLNKYSMDTPADTIKKDSIKIDTSQNKNDNASIKAEMELLFNNIENRSVTKVPVTKGLRISYQLDHTDLKRIQVSESINSALTRLDSDIFNSIELVKNFSAMPEIECSPEKLQLALIHILTNAIQAIEEKKGAGDKGLLFIRTFSNNDNVSINIKDNGIGMTDEVKEKIFETFFTTKAMGKGLGLSTALSIISAHNGTIELNTVCGEGTECIITLPINYVNNTADPSIGLY